MNQLPIPPEIAARLLELRERIRTDKQFKFSKEFRDAAFEFSPYLIDSEYIEARRELFFESEVEGPTL
jgi:hypothetical protein